MNSDRSTAEVLTGILEKNKYRFLLKNESIYYVSKFQRWNWEGQHFLKSPWRGDSVTTSITTFQRNFALSISWPSGKPYIPSILLEVCSRQLNNSASRTSFILSSSICLHCSNRLRTQQYNLLFQYALSLINMCFYFC